jgi:hypothetical protein
VIAGFALGCGDEAAGDGPTMQDAGQAGAGGAAGEAGVGGGAGSQEPVLAPPSDPGWPGGEPLLAAVDRLCTFLLVGPSDSAGYHAAGLNAPGGGGFARLVFDGGDGSFAGRDLASLHPGVVFVDQAESGFSTTDMRAKLEASLGELDPGAAGCDTWVHLGGPGNDFNDNPLTVISAEATATAAASARENYAAMLAALRGVFEDAGEGRTLVASLSTVQDPTDGAGRIPPGFTQGFCELIQSDQFTDAMRAQALENLETLNAEVAAEAAAQGAGVLDQHGALLGHGMPADERWLADDCTHPDDLGHRAIRRYAWYLLTGEWP